MSIIYFMKFKMVCIMKNIVLFYIVGIIGVSFGQSSEYSNFEQGDTKLQCTPVTFESGSTWENVDYIENNQINIDVRKSGIFTFMSIDDNESKHSNIDQNILIRESLSIYNDSDKK